jgi:DNA-binding Lrp family transcriptional regulator
MTDPAATSPTISRHEFPFAQIPHALIEDTVLSHTAVRVYAYLMRRADNVTGNAFPGQRFIAKEIGMSPSTVTKAITDLEDRGWLEVTRRRTKKKEALANHYLVRTTRGGVPNTGTPVPESGTGGVSESVTELDTLLTTPTSLKTRSRDLLWESFVQIHGEPATKSERGKFNRAVAKLKEANVTPGEYPSLVAAFTTKNNGLQGAPMTIAERVGELRHFLNRGPIRTGTVNDMIVRHDDELLLQRQEAESRSLP